VVGYGRSGDDFDGGDEDGGRVEGFELNGEVGAWWKGSPENAVKNVFAQGYFCVTF
jgi:hypothetical protein